MKISSILLRIIGGAAAAVFSLKPVRDIADNGKGA
jgi:hypothetical protein